MIVCAEIFIYTNSSRNTPAVMGRSLNVVFLISFGWLQHVCPIAATVARIMHWIRRIRNRTQLTAEIYWRLVVRFSTLSWKRFFVRGIWYSILALERLYSVTSKLSLLCILEVGLCFAVVGLKLWFCVQWTGLRWKTVINLDVSLGVCAGWLKRSQSQAVLFGAFARGCKFNEINIWSGSSRGLMGRAAATAD